MGALRTSLIWHDEVMHDLVSARPVPITIGPSSEATFVTPAIGLPDEFAIVQPGMRGYLVTLGEHMRGTICVDGVEQDVAQLVRGGGFHATPISGNDWGVVELDATGKYKLFFQFVAREELPMAAPSLDGEQRAGLAFSIALHAVLLLATFRLAESASPFEWPGPRSLTASYLVTRLETSMPVMAPHASASSPTPTITAVSTPMLPAPTFHERAPHPTPVQTPGQVGVLGPSAGSIVDSVIGQHVDFGQHAGKPGGEVKGPSNGHGLVTRGGNQHGGPEGEHHGHDGAIDTGGLRSATVCIGSECGGPPVDLIPTDPPPPGSDGPSLDAKTIDNVVRSASGRLRSCYQKVLDHKSALAGTITIRFVIGPDGKVRSTAVASDTVGDAEVVSCVRRNIQALTFPARGGAIVTYPFVFAPG